MIILSSILSKMIQRIQTVYLLLISIISGGLIFVFDVWTVSGKKEFVLDLFAKDSFSYQSIPLAFFASAVVAFITIFLFRNRQLQFVMGRVVILINLFLLGMLIYLSLNLPGEAAASEKGIGMFLPTLAILFSVMANKAIKKDEDLVKSVDRLR